MTPNDAHRWNYPTLAKPDSDGAYCYHIQRRISVWFSVRLAGRMDANAATGLDLIFGVGASVLVLLDFWLWGVVLIQVFGVFSCVDGEIARIRGCSSKLGDFLDTLADRVTELLLIGAIGLSLGERVDRNDAQSAAFALLGGVFLLTLSSEKFRSIWQMSYPKNQLERFFSLFCAGSDSRLLMLSIGLVVSDVSENGSFLLWTLWALAVAAYVNFLIRIGLVRRHSRTGDRSGS